ncbi:hypothetical protein VQ056_10990 [Paenibacillus sp. JTLBN-2024]
MNTWIFAGLCDKSDTLVHICKLLASGGSSVLLVDASEKEDIPISLADWARSYASRNLPASTLHADSGILPV